MLKATALLGGGGTPGVLTKIPTWIDFDLTFADFAVADVQEDILLYSLPARGHITGGFLKHSELFTGPGILTVESSVGIVGALERDISLFDVLQAPGGGVAQNVNIGDWYNDAAATALRIQLVSTGANLDALTQGILKVSLLLSRRDP